MTRVTYSRLSAAARDTIRSDGRLTIADYVRRHFPDGQWGGDECGCPDDRCSGYHHDTGDECGCLPALLGDVPDSGEQRPQRAPASVPGDVPGDVPGHLPPLDSPAAVVREIAWVAREARALVGSDDEQRRATYFARKAALHEHLTNDDDDFSAGYRAGRRAGTREGADERSAMTVRAPSPWMLDAGTDATAQRGDDVHPDDQGVSYERHVDGWQTTPAAEHLPAHALRVTVGAFVSDNYPSASPEVDVHVDSVPELTVTAVDARRLGQALIAAADMLERR